MCVCACVCVCLCVCVCGWVGGCVQRATALARAMAHHQALCDAREFSFVATLSRTSSVPGGIAVVDVVPSNTSCACVHPPVRVRAHA